MIFVTIYDVINVGFDVIDFVLLQYLLEFYKDEILRT